MADQAPNQFRNNKDDDRMRRLQDHTADVPGFTTEEVAVLRRLPLPEALRVVPVDPAD